MFACVESTNFACLFLAAAASLHCGHIFTLHLNRICFASQVHGHRGGGGGELMALTVTTTTENKHIPCSAMNMNLTIIVVQTVLANEWLR